MNATWALKESRRLPSLQYTIFVFSGCSLSPTSSNRAAILISQHARLLLADAVDHRVVYIALERHGGELSFHPGVERVVQEQVSPTPVRPLTPAGFHGP